MSFWSLTKESMRLTGRGQPIFHGDEVTVQFLNRRKEH